MNRQTHSSAHSKDALFRRLAASSWLLFALAATACSSTKDGPGAGADPLATKAGFCKAWATNACNAVVVDRCQSPSVDACINSQQLFCQSAIPSGYDSTNAQACLERVTEAYSDGVLSASDLAVVIHFGEPCDKLVRGTSAEGETCTRDTDCDTLSGHKCVIKPGASSGECHEPVMAGGGDRCTAPEVVCAEGYYCDGRNCVAQFEAGEPCENDAECKADLRCVISDPGDGGAPSGVCEARKAASSKCTSHAECASNYCGIAKGDADGLCASSVQLSQREPVCEDLR